MSAGVGVGVGGSGCGVGKAHSSYSVLARDDQELESLSCDAQTVEVANQSTEWYNSETIRIASNCERMLNSIKWQTSSPNTYEGLLKRFDMMEKEGLPDMLVLPATTLLSLGRIPRSHERDPVTQEPYTIKARSAVEKLGGYGLISGKYRETIAMAKIFFFSHRWKRGEWCETLGRDLPWGSKERVDADKSGLYVGDPDGADHEKAAALVAWAMWYAMYVSESGSIDNLFFWIDWPCVDQENKGPSMAALPAYVAVSHNIVAAWTNDYDGRAWCQVERMMACSYMAEGDRIYAFSEGFANSESEDVIKEETLHVAPCPSSGTTTNPDDKEVIESLQKVASRSKIFSIAALCIPFLEIRLRTLIFIFALSACSVLVPRPGWPLAKCAISALFLFFYLTFAVAFFCRQRINLAEFRWLYTREARPGLGKVNRVFVYGPHEVGIIPRIEAVEPDIGGTAACGARAVLLLGILWCLLALEIFVSNAF